MKHKYIDTFHCADCMDICIRRAAKSELSSKGRQVIIVSPIIKKYWEKLNVYKRTT